MRQLLGRRRGRRKHAVICRNVVILGLLCCIHFGTLVANETSEPAQNTAAVDDDIDGPVIGIDLGAFDSCVAVALENGQVHIIPNDQGNRLTPSYVAVTNTGERLVGDAAKQQHETNLQQASTSTTSSSNNPQLPGRVIWNVKRLLGRKFSDASVQAVRNSVSYRIISDKCCDLPRILVATPQQRNSTMMFSPEDIISMIFSQLKATAEAFLGQAVRDAVVTIPGYFTEDQRQATEKAAAMAGLNVKRYISEHVAAVVAFGLDKTTTTTPDLGERNVLVYALGGDTVGVTLLTIDHGVVDVVAGSYENPLRDEHFDERVMNRHGISNKFYNLQRVLETAVKLVSLGRFNMSMSLSGPYFKRFKRYLLFQQAMGPVKRVLKEAGLSKSQVDGIILVGGSTLSPTLQPMLSKFFNGKQLVNSNMGIHAAEVLAYGAAVHARRLSTEQPTSSCTMELVPLSLGIETGGGGMFKIIPRGVIIPFERTQTFSTHRDNQSVVTINVLEGERILAKDNCRVGTFVLSGIAPAPRGVPHIDVTFWADAAGYLKVSATDQSSAGNKSNDELIVQVKTGRQSEEEIELMFLGAEQHAEEDRQIKQRLDARYMLESYLIGLQCIIDNGKASRNHRLLIEDQNELRDIIFETWDWMKAHLGAEVEELDIKQKAVMKIVNTKMPKIYTDKVRGSNRGECGDEAHGMMGMLLE